MTGVTPNVAARIAFFRSIESGFRYQGDPRKLDGSLVLDKITWLGDTTQITELLLALTVLVFARTDVSILIFNGFFHLIFRAQQVHNKCTTHSICIHTERQINLLFRR